MEQSQLALLAEIPGLEAAKQAIEHRINEIRALLGQPIENVVAPRQLRPIPLNDPDVLGRDVLGRIKRKRNLTSEQREQKRQLIAAARKKKLDALAATKMEAK